MFVKPAPGLKIRNPATGLELPESGAEVPEEQYWRRRVIDGDVIEVPPVSAPAKKAAEKKE